MNFRRESTLLVAFAALALAAVPAWAQYGYAPQGMDPRLAAYGPPGMPPGGVAPAFYHDPAMMGPMPGGPMGPPPNSPEAPPGAMSPMPAPDGYCDACGGAGCGACCGGWFGRGGLLDCGCYDGSCGCLNWLCDGFGDGYRCRPRWYDVTVDFVSLKRDSVSRTVVFATDGQGAAAPVALSSDDLVMGTGNGARITGAWLIGPGTALEASWMGGFFWDDSALAVSQTNDLFSPYSDFGTDPLNGFDDTDRASAVSIGYNSKLDTVELSIRRRFQEPECRYQGSFLYGFRWIRLNENLNYFTRGNDGADFADTDVETSNNLYGAQVGYEFNIRPIPRVLLDAQWKVGVYGNSADTITNVVSTTIPTGFTDNNANTEIAFASELNFNVVLNLNERWSFRAGYNLFYVDGVALATENFNAGPPFIANAREPFINVNGSLFVHGYNVGFEHNW